MKERTKTGVFPFIAVGALLLFNPTFNILDPIPDFIGYILFIIGLGEWAYLSDEFLSARRNFIRLTALGLLKMLACTILPYADDTTVLLLSFVFAIAEAILFIPAITSLMSGMDYIYVRYSKNEKTVSSPKKLTVAAFLIRAASAVLPVLPASMSVSSDIGQEGVGGFGEFTNLYYFFAAVITLAVGIPWAVKFFRYAKSIERDPDVRSVMSERYSNEVLTEPGKLRADRMRAVLVLSVLSAVFLLNMYVDDINIFPNVISALAVAASFILLFGDGKALAVSGIVSAIGWGAMSVKGEFLLLAYRKENYRPESAVYGIGKSAEMYSEIELFSYIEAVFFMLTAVIFSLLIIRAVRKDVSPVREKFRLGKKSLKIRAALCIAALVISVPVDVLITPLRKEFPEIWLINAGVTALLVIVTVNLYAYLTDRVYDRL